MNKILIVCLIGVASLNVCAARVLRRDVSHGYQYHAGHSSGGGGFLQAPTSFTSSSSYAPSASGNSYFNSLPSISNAGTSGFVPSTQTVLFNGGGSSGSFGGSSGGSSGSFLGSSGSFGGSSGSFGGSSSGISQIQYNEHAFHHQAPIITKHFYLHSAPEDHDEQQIVRYVNVGRPQQNYRVVFINAPTSSVSKAKIIANVAPVEDKTAIYVLAKKSNALDVSAEVVTQAPTHHKPEVFFVKYKTPAEAEHAQHVIQAQYDSLGGSSQVTNEGIVPVSSVIGSLGGNDASAEGSTGGSFSIDTEQSQNIGPAVNVISTGDNTQQTYLPSHQK